MAAAANGRKKGEPPMEDIKKLLAEKAASPEVREAVMCARLMDAYRAWVDAGRPAKAN